MTREDGPEPLVQVVLLIPDGLIELELNDRPLQIEPWAAHLEVSVATEMIGEKTHTKFKTDQLDRRYQQGSIRRRKQMPGLLAITGEQSLEKVWIENRGVRVRVDLPLTVAAGAETVAQVMEQQTRFDGVEIDETDGLVRIRCKKNIGGFRIAMDHLQGQLFASLF